MAATNSPLALLAARRSSWVDQLSEFVAIPSVSADPRHRDDVRRAAEWLRQRLAAVGMRRAVLLETRGHPLVRAEWTSSAAPASVLFYGHYDVVAPGAVSAWRSPPFAPCRRGRFLYGRGASDDKGPLLCHLAALEAWLSTAGRLPVNVSCLFEGEEEIGSPNLRRLLARRPRLNGRRPVDAVVISDTRMLAPGRPALITGLRGGLAAEIEVVGPAHELHSGAFGGAVRNPAHALAELVAGLHDRSGRVSIEGFYRDVRAAPRLREEELVQQILASQIAAEAGTRFLFGEPGFSPGERATVRPALDVNGVHAGHIGPGGKGVIPAKATAKLSFRLVPDQDPRRVAALLQSHIARHRSEGLPVRTSFSKLSRPVVIDPGSPALSAAKEALAAGFGRQPVLLRSGGTIPVVELLAARVGVPVLMGFARADDGMHGPNERVDLAALAAGARSIVHFLERIGRHSSHQPERREEVTLG